MDLLLLSNSTNYGQPMFTHAAEAFAEVAAGDPVTFVPYALADWDDYADRVTAAFGAFDIEVVSAHRSGAPDRAILEAEVVMMGGGNTLPAARHPLRPRRDRGARPPRARRRDPVHGRVGRHQRRVPDDPHHQRHADLPTAELRPLWVWCRSRSTCTTSTPTRTRRSWGRAARSGSRSSSRRTTARCSPCTRVRGCGSAGTTATVTGPARLFQRTGSEAFADGFDVSNCCDLTPKFDDGRRPARLIVITAGADPSRSAVSFGLQSSLSGDLSGIRPVRPDPSSPLSEPTSRSAMPPSPSVRRDRRRLLRSELRRHRRQDGQRSRPPLRAVRDPLGDRQPAVGPRRRRGARRQAERHPDLRRTSPTRSRRPDGSPTSSSSAWRPRAACSRPPSAGSCSTPSTAGWTSSTACTSS